VSDIKLFRLDSPGVVEIAGQSVVIEKTLQTLIEKNLEAFLGVEFLKSEYSTGKTHGGRIDSLGIDENFSPVIIEYKRSQNENVINQGLYYLDWLLDHQAEFALLAMKRLGADVEEKIDWDGTRLICIAYDFTKYDEHAVSQINRNIELIRYRTYGSNLMLFELVNARSASPQSHDAAGASGGKPAKGVYKGVSEYLATAPPPLQNLYHGLRNHLIALDDVQQKVTKQYVAFRRLKNFACVEVHPQAMKLLVYIKINPDDVVLEPGFTRDVRKIGHFGTGDLEITITSAESLERAKPLVMASYEAN
jgi:predicted transport protein